MPSSTDPPDPREEPGTERREVARIVRGAALTVYGVTAVVGARWLDRVSARLGIGEGGVKLGRDPLEVELNIEIAPTVPREQVVSNVRDAVTYAVQRDLGRPLRRLTVTIEGI